MQMDDNPLAGKVAALVNTRELVINIGSSDGVEVGMIFSVLSGNPIKILDPDTSEEIGEIDREKVRVKAIEVKPKMSICKTYKTYTVGGFGMLAALEPTFGLGQARRTVVETLKMEDAKLPPPLTPEESYVKIGDRVSQVIEPSELS